MSRQDDMWRDAEIAEHRGRHHDIASGLRDHVSGAPKPQVTYRDGQAAEIHPPEEREEPAPELDLASQIGAIFDVPPRLIRGSESAQGPQGPPDPRQSDERAQGEQPAPTVEEFRAFLEEQLVEMRRHYGEQRRPWPPKAKTTITDVEPEPGTFETNPGTVPPKDVAQAIEWVKILKNERGMDHRPGTGPAYRDEGEQNAFDMVLRLLRTGDPEMPD